MYRLCDSCLQSLDLYRRFVMRIILRALRGSTINSEAARQMAVFNLVQSVHAGLRHACGGRRTRLLAGNTLFTGIVVLETLTDSIPRAPATIECP